MQNYNSSNNKQNREQQHTLGRQIKPIMKFSINEVQINSELMFRKRQWTQREDKLLINAINKHGPKKWAFIAQFVPNRVGKQCRQRWHNHLNPKINKSEWTQKQQWLLYLMHLIYGGKWAKMMKILTQRTDNCIKNHWNSIMRKKIPFYQQRLKQILINQNQQLQQKNNSQKINPQKTSIEQKQKYFLDKIKQKYYSNKNVFQNDDKQQEFSSIQSIIGRNQEGEENQNVSFQQTKEMVRNKSQFQVNIDGILPQTTEVLPLKQKSLSYFQNKIQTNVNKNNSNTNQNNSIIQQYEKLEQTPLLIPIFTKSQSFNQNVPASFLLQKQQSSDFQIYGSNMKKRSNNSFIQQNQFCKSPKLKSRYSQIYPDQDQMVQLDKQILFSYDQDDKPILKRRLSRNISLVSPTKFINQKSNSLS